VYPGSVIVVVDVAFVAATVPSMPVSAPEYDRITALHESPVVPVVRFAQETVGASLALPSAIRVNTLGLARRYHCAAQTATSSPKAWLLLP
jgi:hypothetical protein